MEITCFEFDYISLHTFIVILFFWLSSDFSIHSLGGIICSKKEKGVGGIMIFSIEVSLVWTKKKKQKKGKIREGEEATPI